MKSRKLSFFSLYLKELGHILKQVNESEFQNLVKEIKHRRRIFVAGSGRSSLVVKSLAMRLMRSDKTVFVIGETITPKIIKEDLLIVISGSGETGEIISVVKIARVMGAKIFGLTAVPDSPLAKLAHYLILVPAKIPIRTGSQYQLRELIGVPERSPTKSLFETCALIITELAIAKLNDDE